MAKLEQFSYDNAIVRKFAYATIIFGVVGMLVGLLLALQLIWPWFNLGLPETTFGRIRPLHTNAAIFAFVGNGIFTGVYYSLQRLLKTRMFSDTLSNIHFWGWQLIILAAAITLPLGITSSHEYAELEWPIDIAIALIWVVFGINMFGTILKRRGKPPVCSHLVLHRYLGYRNRSAHFQQPGITGQHDQKLSGICGGTGCAGTMVVWP